MFPSDQRLGVALAGCGRFGDFCLSAVRDLPQVLLVGVTDTDPVRAMATAARAISGPTSVTCLTWSGDNVQVPDEKQLVKDAPRIDPNGHLSEAEEQQLWRYYGLQYGAGSTGTATQGAGHRGRRPARQRRRRRPGGRLRYDQPDQRRGDDPVRGGVGGRHPGA